MQLSRLPAGNGWITHHARKFLPFLQEVLSFHDPSIIDGGNFLAPRIISGFVLSTGCDGDWVDASVVNADGVAYLDV